MAASEPEAVRCGVCGSAELERIDRETLERIAAAEGTLSEEVTYDGRKLRWSEAAKRALWTLKDAYKRRRAKARIEKSASADPARSSMSRSFLRSLSRGR